MKHNILKSLCTLLMGDDPTLLTEESRGEVESWVNEEAKKLGFTDWVDAYHRADDADHKMPSSVPSTLSETMDWIKQLSKIHGEEKAQKIIDCMQGVSLALKMFDEDVARAAVETLHTMFQD